jgi:hypothetical protein
MFLSAIAPDLGLHAAMGRVHHHITLHRAEFLPLMFASQASRIPIAGHSRPRRAIHYPSENKCFPRESNCSTTLLDEGVPFKSPLAAEPLTE